MVSQSVSQSYDARRVDKYSLTCRSIPYNGVMYKSGSARKNSASYFRNPFPSRSTCSPQAPAGSRQIKSSRFERRYVQRVVPSSGDL